MPRAGLHAADLVQAAAAIADELGYQQLTLGLVAERLGVRSPSLYKHVAGLADLQHQLAALAMTELGDAVADAAAGLAGKAAL
ncbi:MAG: TetR/AcrR family transcriptional regulator, partial [Actinomycetota bacterium]